MSHISFLRYFYNLNIQAEGEAYLEEQSFSLYCYTFPAFAI